MSTVQLTNAAKVSGRPVASGRIDGLDTLRALLAVFVVLLHASMPYMLAPFPGLAWPVHDAAPSAWVDAVGWWCDSLVMPTFLLMAGFFAAQLMERKGARGFLANRLQRVLRPLMLGMIVLLPIELYLWLTAWVGQGAIPFGKLRSLKIESPHGDHLWGLSHLWFLEYLFLYSLVAWCIVRVRRRDRDSVSPADCSAKQVPSTSGGEGQGQGHRQNVQTCSPHPSPLPHITIFQPTISPFVGERGQEQRFPLRAGASWLVPLLGGLIAGGSMCWHPRVLIGFSHGWLPHPANFLCFGLIFACGWSLANRHARGANVTAGCELLAAAGLLLFAISLPGLREFAALGDADAHVPWTTAIPFGLSGWLSAVGWWGVFLKHFNYRPANFLCYLAESSFWLYLVHHPLVALLQIDLALMNWSSGWKFVTASFGAIAISLAMYECLVRRTTLGAILNGRRQQNEPSSPIEVQPMVDADRPRRAA